MYYAIQASLGLDTNPGGNDIEDLGAWDDKGHQSGFGHGASRQKTPSTGDNLSNKNNNSMDSDQLFHCEDDDELGFNNYNQTPSKLQRKNQRGRGRSDLVAPEIHIANLEGSKKPMQNQKTEGP